MRRFLKFCVGLLLLPLCAALSLTFVRLLVLLAQSPHRLPHLPVFAVLAGMVVWLLVWFFLPPLTKTYVLGHELTHAVWSLLCGGRARNLRVSDAGGSVRVTKNNFLVTLAPYFFPFYSVLGILLWLLLSALFPPVRPWYPLLLFWLGLSWTFHACFTLRFLAWSQPDVREQGRLFSYTLIFFLNLLILVAALVSVSPWTFRDAAADFLSRLAAFAAAARTFFTWFDLTFIA